MKKALLTIRLATDGNKLPTEFRLFTRGVNHTEKGDFVFDDKAAKTVMAAHEAWGVDVMIDLEHMSLGTPDGAPDPTARDARGWCRLELRDGELWAVGVTWTPDGAERLRAKRQRYISPAFETDKKNRITKVVNIALVALPATHNTPALVAASRRTGRMAINLKALNDAQATLTRAGSAGSSELLAQGHRLIRLAAEGGGLDPALVKQALDAVEKGDAKAALDILKGLIAAAAGCEPEPDGDEDGSEGDGAEGVAPPAPVEESVEEPEVTAGEEGEEESDEEEDPKKTKKMAFRACGALLLKMTATSDLMEALNIVEVWRSSHATIETERKQLAKDRMVLEGSERKKLCVELISLGAEFPATVWADPLEEKPSKLKPRWTKMPIAELRAHVADQRSARRKNTPTKSTGPKLAALATRRGVPDDLPKLKVQPEEVDDETLGLDASDLAICKATGCDPAVYAKLKTTRDNASRGN